MRPLTVSLALALAVTLLSSGPAAAQDDAPVFYMAQYKVHWQRVDSLRTLVTRYDQPWHDFVADHVEGYQRWYFVHDTGNEYNYMTLTRYPNWDSIRGDEIPYSDLWPRFLESIGMTADEFQESDIQSGFGWVMGDSQHFDQIWLPIEADDEGDDDG